MENLNKIIEETDNSDWGAGWIDIKIEMPDIMEFVLFCENTNYGLIGGNTQTLHIGWFDEINQWYSECAGWMDEKTITHWMRLPSPPDYS